MGDYNFHIDTPRLVISHLDSQQDSHCDFLVELYNSETALSTKSISAPVSGRESARQKIESDDRVFTSGYGRYLVSLQPPEHSKGPEDLSFSERSKTYVKIGVVTMKRRHEDGPSAPDVGYGLLPAFQGKGYATEAAAALVRWFEDEKGQKEFFGFCDPANEGSKAVLKRIGFEQRGLKGVKGLKPDGDVIQAMVFSKGIGQDLENYGLI